MRDKNGNYQVEIPSMPVMDDEALPEDSVREKKGAISSSVCYHFKEEEIDLSQSLTRGWPRCIGIGAGSSVNPQVNIADSQHALVITVLTLKTLRADRLRASQSTQ